MPTPFPTLSVIYDHGADTLIDVRSPAEFATDHVPGAINLPALSNAERAEVGTIYVQDSAFRARKIGAAMVARNVATHLEGPLADKSGSWRPLVYCWRGGQRSGSFASILIQIGWRAETVAGGYQQYRRLVADMLHDQPLRHRLILLDGNTGTGKTEILSRLADMGMQVIDLEGMANHRGSLLGARDGGQPSQKMFETRLAQALTRCDPTQPVVVEAESSKIGRLNLPPSLWAAMVAAPRIMVTAQMQARARFLAGSYAEIAADPAQLRDRLNSLRRIRGHALVDRWDTLLRSGDMVALACALIAEHYDPAYLTSRKAVACALLGNVDASGLTDDDLNRAAQAVAGVISPAG